MSFLGFYPGVSLRSTPGCLGSDAFGINRKNVPTPGRRAAASWKGVITGVLLALQRKKFLAGIFCLVCEEGRF